MLPSDIFVPIQWIRMDVKNTDQEPEFSLTSPSQLQQKEDLYKYQTVPRFTYVSGLTAQKVQQLRIYASWTAEASLKSLKYSISPLSPGKAGILTTHQISIKALVVIHLGYLGNYF